MVYSLEEESVYSGLIMADESVKRAPVPKRLYYGWIVVAISFLTVTLSATVQQSFIVIFPAMLQEFAWSRTVFSLAPALFGLVLSCNAFLVGYLSDRTDIKRLIPLGAPIAAAGLIPCFFIRDLWQMIVFFGIICAVGGGAISLLPNTIIVSNWFVRMRGTAIGIVASGSGAGILAFIPLLQLVINAWGWRVGYLALALAVGPLLIPLIILFQKSHPAQAGLTALENGPGQPESQGARISESIAEAGPAAIAAPAAELGTGVVAAPGITRSLLRNRRFWICVFQFILGPLSTMPIITHQAALLQGKGLSSMGSALVVGVYGLSVFCGMIIGGTLSDSVGREWSYTAGTLSIIIGTLWLLSVPSGTGLGLPLLYAVFFGLGFGTRPSMDSATAADIFKGRYFGLIFGVLQLALGIGLFGGPILGGFIYDRSGSYTAAVVFCMVAVVVATACIWIAAPRRGREQGLV
jgi:MFS family permease